ncbi:hypothetical protein Tco_1279094 [Tanacetum coccineum]
MREFLNELKNADGNEHSESAADTATPRSLFDFDVSYEIECECDDPEQAKLMLEEMLRSIADQMAVLAMDCCDMIRQNRHDLASDVWRVLEPLGVSCELSSFIVGSEGQSQIPHYFVQSFRTVQ